ncbi:MAG: hypothetical protein CMP91_01810 [Gammaproteobacteria bacterium]|nr:hypothetical protein [Gammaproteobacteria bacterium]|tara:strand:+ start:36717 stop:37577 length:861 start_codon:yes stop_codon:yes gene_type:complete
MTREEALEANKHGAIAACISGLITIVVVIIALTSDSDGIFSYWRDPLNLIDAVLIFLCAYGMYKNSRTAAVFIFVYFIIARVVIGIESGSFSGLGVSIIFLYFYGKAIQGTFTFHKLQKEADPTYKASPKWMIFVGFPVIAIFVILIGLGLLTMTSMLPSTEVLYQSQIAQSDIDTLKSEGIIFEEDRVEYFYSYGFTSILEGGNLLTSDRVLIYFPNEQDEIVIYEMYFSDISSVEKIQNGGVFSDSLYRINGLRDEEWLLLELSTENQGDTKFVQAINDKIRLP